MGQTAAFPGAIATDANLTVARNRVQTKLAQPMAASDTVIWLASATGIVVNQLLTVDNEIMLVTAISPNILVTRAFDSTVAAAHATRAVVSNYIAAWSVNSPNAEIKAIETALGANLANVASTQVVATGYDFAPQTPGGSLIIGNNSVTMTPVPRGVNGTDVGHYLYVSAGTGTAEACVITGGAGTSGQTTGVIILNCANTHSGAWTFKSATAGVVEAATVLPAAGGVVFIPAATYTIYGTITIARTSGVCIQGAGQRSTILSWAGATSGDMIFFDGPHSPGGSGLNHCLEHLQATAVNHTNTNTGIHADNQASLLVDDISISYASNPVNVTGAGSQSNAFRHMYLYAATGDAVLVNTALVGGYFDDVTAVCSDTALASSGFHFVADAGSVIRNSYTVGCGNGLLMNPSSTVVRLVEITNTYFDCGPGNGIKIAPTSTGQVIASWFRGTTTACATLDGVYIGSTGTVAGISFQNHFSLLNTRNGYNLNGGTDIILSNSFGAGNGALAANTWDGLAAAGVTNLQITGGMYGGYFSQLNTQRYGINIGTGVTALQISGVTALANNTAGINDAATGTGVRTVRGLDTAIVTIASATTIDPGPTDPESLFITGSTTITGILRAWDLRRLTLVNISVGSQTIMGHTVGTNTSLSCIYSAGYTGWFCQ